MKSATEPWIRFTALASKRKISEGMWKKMLDYTLEMLVGDGTISFWLPLHLYILGSTRVKRKRETDGRYIYDVYIARCASVLAWCCLAVRLPGQLVENLFAQHQRLAVCCPYWKVFNVWLFQVWKLDFLLQLKSLVKALHDINLLSPLHCRGGAMHAQWSGIIIKKRLKEQNFISSI